MDKNINQDTETIERICYGCREMLGDRDDHKCVSCQWGVFHETFYFDDTKETVKNPNFKPRLEE